MIEHRPSAELGSSRLGWLNALHDLSIRADARVSGATLQRGTTISYPLAAGWKAHLVSARGQVTVNGIEIQSREGAAISAEAVIRITALENAELVFVETA